MAEAQTAPAMPAHGTFCWNELMTTDDEAAKNFYGALFGWQYKAGDVPGMAYNEIHQGGMPFGGLMKMGAEFGDTPSHWMAYVAVDDVDATAAKVTELGGSVCVPPTDIPNVGRFAVINDPTGAALSVIALSAP
jgi:predicted enzyme related to lactoylglutathione lyase